LHIPEHINFECSGCGNCCLEWPVPATAADVVRIETLASSAGFRRLNAGDQRFRGFTHTLEKRADGRCQYLSEENRCKLQLDHGAEAKPAMCRLFPHAFSVTPSGVYAYVSFASSAVLYNRGRALKEQEDVLEERFELYKQLFPDVRTDWTKLQILDGFPLAWSEFMELDEALVKLVSDFSQPTLVTLQACSALFLRKLPRGADPETMPPIEAPPEIVDQLILKHLGRAYLPPDLFADEQFDLDNHTLMTDIISAPNAVSLGEQSFDRLREVQLGELPSEIENLFQRFIYARVFAKLFLGPNLAHLSAVAGIHHLFFVIAIARLNLKLLILAGGEVTFETAAEVVRTIERRLSQMNFSPKSSAALEVLLSSPSRLPRVAALVR
jgi:Fe-S-cluster containining protein